MLQVLVHSRVGGQVGLVVDDIVDISTVVVDRRDGRGFIAGTSVVGARVTDVIDTEALLDDLLGAARHDSPDDLEVQT